MLTLLLGCPQPSVPTTDTGDPPVVCEGDEETGATFLVQPYVQHVLDDEAWILWETDVGTGSRVEDQNEFFGADTQADDDLTDEVVELEPGTATCWRVRYRDEGLAWSSWSSGTEAAVPGC